MNGCSYWWHIWPATAAISWMAYVRWRHGGASDSDAAFNPFSSEVTSSTSVSSPPSMDGRIVSLPTSSSESSYQCISQSVISFGSAFIFSYVLWRVSSHFGWYAGWVGNQLHIRFIMPVHQFYSDRFGNCGKVEYISRLTLVILADIRHDCISVNVHRWHYKWHFGVRYRFILCQRQNGGEYSFFDKQNKPHQNLWPHHLDISYWGQHKPQHCYFSMMLECKL